MRDSQILAIVRGVHTLIYIAMVIAIAVLLFAGFTGYIGLWLWVALGLLAVESVVFLGNGMRCPLTKLAVKFGAEGGYVFDTFLPERVTRYTFRFFGALMLFGLALLCLRLFVVLV